MARKSTSERTTTMVRSGSKKGGRVTYLKPTIQGTSQQPPTSLTQTSRVSRPSYEEIAKRAKEIWQAKGCPSGCDQQNWCEAEAQLKKECGIC